MYADNELEPAGADVYAGALVADARVLGVREAPGARGPRRRILPHEARRLRAAHAQAPRRARGVGHAGSRHVFLVCTAFWYAANLSEY